MLEESFELFLVHIKTGCVRVQLLLTARFEAEKCIQIVSDERAHVDETVGDKPHTCPEVATERKEGGNFGRF